MSKVYYEDDDLTPLLAGRYVVDAETYDDTTYPDERKGKLSLDDGTVLILAGNDGCGGCDSGWYYLTRLFRRGTPNARIMSAEVETTQLGDDEYDDTRYTLFVIVDDERLPLAEFDGDDGNGCYGTGFNITVTREEAAA